MHPFQIRRIFIIFCLSRLSGTKPSLVVAMRRMPANIFINYTWRIIFTALQIAAHFAFFFLVNSSDYEGKKSCTQFRGLAHTKSSEKTNLIWKKRKFSFKTALDY